MEPRLTLRYRPSLYQGAAEVPFAKAPIWPYFQASLRQCRKTAQMIERAAMTNPQIGLQFCRRRRIAGMIAAAAGIVMLAGSAAQAFTFNDQPSTGSNNGAKFADPTERAKSRMTGESGDRTTIRNGNTTLQFGGRESSDQRSPTDRYFNPDVLMGR